MPFTPRWLIHHGREEDARKTLSLLRAMPAEHELIELEFLEIKAQSMFEKRTVEANFPHLRELTAMNTIKLQFVAIGSLFKTMPMFRRVIVATVTMFFQQWTGINAVLYYAPQVGFFPRMLKRIQAHIGRSLALLDFLPTPPRSLQLVSSVLQCCLLPFQQSCTLTEWDEGLRSPLELWAWVFATSSLPSSLQRTNISGLLTTQQAGQPSSWSGCLSSISVGLGVLGKCIQIRDG